MEGFRQTGLGEGLLPGLIGLVRVAVAPEPAGTRRGSSTVILGLRAVKVVLVAVVVAAGVAGVVALASGVVTERRRVSPVRAERSMLAWSMSRTESTSSAVRIGKMGSRELP